MDSGRLLSIIIVNWNVRDLLRTCLVSVAREMRVADDDYEVLVIDNASADDSVFMLRAEFPRVRLIESPVNLGFGAGCNRAFQEARGEYVLLLNPDTEVIDHAIDGLLETMRTNPRAGIVAPRLANPDRSFQPAAGGAFPTLWNVAWNFLFLKNLLPAALAPATTFLDGDPQGLLSIDWVSGASMLIRRAAIGERIFDEAFFMFGEDMDLCDRVRRAGWDVLYTSTHSIIHHHGRSFERQDTPAVLAMAHRGPRLAFRKRHGAFSAFVYDAILCVGYLIRWPLFGILSVLRPDSGYGARAKFSRAYLLNMFRDSTGHDAATRRT